MAIDWLVPHSFHKQISIAEESMHYIWMNLLEEFQDKASLASDTCCIEIGEKTKNMKHEGLCVSQRRCAL